MREVEPVGPQELFDAVQLTYFVELADVADPTPNAGEVLVRVHATAVNRADLMQREGHYPPPAGASEILGLEAAGEVVELGPGVAGVAVGDRVMALLSAGGYAELVPAGAPAGCGALARSCFSASNRFRIS